MNKIAEEDFKCEFCGRDVLKGQEYRTVFDTLEEGDIISGTPACDSCVESYYNSFW